MEIAELCKGVHCVDLGESFQTHIYLKNWASIQPTTIPVKFARSTDSADAQPPRPHDCRSRCGAPQPAETSSRSSCFGARRECVIVVCFSEFHRARSRLYRSQVLQVNTHWKALAEIYTMHSFASFSWDPSGF